MTKRIIKNFDLIKALNQCNNIEKKQFLKSARPEIVNTVCDCVHNVLQGKVPLSNQHKNKLKLKKHILRQLVDRKNKTSKRRKLLTQHGSGFLSSILGPVIKVIAEVIE